MPRSVVLRAALVAVALQLAPGIEVSAQARPAAAANTSTRLELIGIGGAHKTLTEADIAKMPHVDATVSSHNVQGKYSGVLLGELLKLVGRPVGEALRGKALATAVSVEAADNYKIIFALAEVDSGFTSKVILLADRKNGAPIDASEGPFRIIVPDEARPARWAKQVVRIRLVPVE